jgi:hypothetical protein
MVPELRPQGLQVNIIWIAIIAVFRRRVESFSPCNPGSDVFFSEQTEATGGQPRHVGQKSATYAKKTKGP